MTVVSGVFFLQMRQCQFYGHSRLLRNNNSEVAQLCKRLSLPLPLFPEFLFLSTRLHMSMESRRLFYSQGLKRLGQAVPSYRPLCYPFWEFVFIFPLFQFHCFEHVLGCGLRMEMELGRALQQVELRMASHQQLVKRRVLISLPDTRPSANQLLITFSLDPPVMVSCSGDLAWKVHFAISRALCSIWLWYLEHSGLNPAFCDLQGRGRRGRTWNRS